MLFHYILLLVAITLALASAERGVRLLCFIIPRPSPREFTSRTHYWEVYSTSNRRRMTALRSLSILHFIPLVDSAFILIRLRFFFHSWRFHNAVFNEEYTRSPYYSLQNYFLIDHSIMNFSLSRNSCFSYDVCFMRYSERPIVLFEEWQLREAIATEWIFHVT